MITIKVNHNPVDEPIKFPSKITYLKCSNDLVISEVIEQFTKDNKQVIITYNKVPNQWLQ